MHSILPIVALLAVCANTALVNIDRPNEDYYFAMCYPLIASLGGRNAVVAAMENSPFPCEQGLFLSMICSSNGTTPNDFLAEQQCFCGGNFFEAMLGCEMCGIAHGLHAASAIASVSSVVSSFSVAECSPSPPIQPYSNLFSTYASDKIRPDFTLLPDNFPNDTRVANYWTGATAPIAGEITGSAIHHQSIRTNLKQDRFTPTAAATTGGSETAPSAPTSTGNAETATSTGAGAEVRVAGGLLAAVIGVLAVL